MAMTDPVDGISRWASLREKDRGPIAALDAHLAAVRQRFDDREATRVAAAGSKAQRKQEEDREWERLQVLLVFTAAGGLLSLLVLPSVFSILALLCWFVYAMRVQDRRDAIDRAARRDANIATLESELGIRPNMRPLSEAV